MKKHEEKHINEILQDLADEFGFDYGPYKFIFDQVISRVVEENMNGNPVRLYPLGLYEIREYKSREVQGFEGEKTTLPPREKLKFKVSELFEKLYEYNEYYTEFKADYNNPYNWTVVINKNTPKVAEEGIKIVDCLQTLAEQSWKGYYLMEVETEEEMQEIDDFLMSHASISDKQIAQIEEQIAKSKDTQERMELRKYLKICDVIKINMEKERYETIVKQL